MLGELKAWQERTVLAKQKPHSFDEFIGFTLTYQTLIKHDLFTTFLKAVETEAMSEFKNKTFQTFVKNENVYHFMTYNETKAQVVEFFNRTLKKLMWWMFTTKSSYRDVDKRDSLAMEIIIRVCI